MHIVTGSVTGLESTYAMSTIVTILKGDVTRICVDGSGYRRETMYAHGDVGGYISVWLDDGSRAQVFSRGGAAPVWKSSDRQEQAHQIARDHRCQVIDEAEVDAWAVRAQVVAAREEAEDAWVDAQFAK